MDDPIFDAIAVLCDAAEEDGFVAVADALELVLDVYLLERAQLCPTEPVFRSKRMQGNDNVAAWHADAAQDVQVNWSMDIFPLRSSV